MKKKNMLSVMCVVLAATLAAPSYAASFAYKQSAVGIRGGSGGGGTTPETPKPETFSAITATPTSLTFGSTVVGESSGPQAFVIGNSGSGVLNISSITVAPPYSATNTCGAGVAPGGNCSIFVSFSPIGVGPNQNGSAIVVSDSKTNGTLTLTMTGAGLSNTPSLSTNPGSLDFSTQDVGTTSTAKSVTLTNNGNVVANIGTLTPPTGFVMATDNCSGKALAKGANCTFSVQFAPTVSGTYNSGVLEIPGVPGTTVAFSGMGKDVFSVAANTKNISTDFGGLKTGAKSAASTFTFRNDSTTTISNVTTSVTGTGVNKDSTTCGATLAKGATCDIVVSITPTAVGSVSGTVTLAHNTNGTAGSAKVDITGVAQESDPYWGNVSYLLHGDGSAVDMKGHSVTPNGGATVLSSSGKYAGAFNLPINSHVAFTSGAENDLSNVSFTLDTWLYLRQYPGSGGYAIVFYKKKSYTLLTIETNGGNTYLTSSSVADRAPLVASIINPIPLNTWTHLTLSVDRASGLNQLCVNGVQVSTGNKPVAANSADAPTIAGGSYTTGAIDGMIDEFRLTKGVARGCQMPTGPYPNN